MKATFIIILLVASIQLVEGQSIIKVNGNYCVDSQVTFVFTGSCSTYAWSIATGVNGVDYTILSTSNTSFTLKWLKATNTTVRMSCSSGVIYTLPVSIGANLSPSVSLSMSPSAPACQGTNVTFTAAPVNGGTSPSYSWRINGS